MEASILAATQFLPPSRSLQPSSSSSQGLHGSLLCIRRRYFFRNSALSSSCKSNSGNRSNRDCFLVSFAQNIFRSSPAAARVPFKWGFTSNAASSSGSGGGGDGVGGLGGGSGGGGDGGASSGEAETKSVAGETEGVSSLGSDFITLNVGGMSCGGCAASVKRILESQPEVSSASVDLATETAFVWATEDVKATEDWQQNFGERLANHLTTCGFKSKLRGQEIEELKP